VTPRDAYGVMAALTLTLAPALFGTSALEVGTVLCLAATLRAVIWTVSYPLGADGAERTGAGLGVVMGVMNGAWALAVVVSPVAAGALFGPLGSKATFGVSELLCLAALAVGWYVLRTRPRRLAEGQPLAEDPPLGAAHPLADVAV